MSNSKISNLNWSAFTSTTSDTIITSSITKCIYDIKRC